MNLLLRNENYKMCIIHYIIKQYEYGSKDNVRINYIVNLYTKKKRFLSLIIVFTK